MSWGDGTRNVHPRVGTFRATHSWAMQHGAYGQRRSCEISTKEYLGGKAKRLLDILNGTHRTARDTLLWVRDDRWYGNAKYLSC